MKNLISIVTNDAWEEGRESPGLEVLWGMLYADDAGIVSRSKDSLAKIMSVVVETCDAFGLTVSENKIETKALLPPAAPAERLSILVAGQRSVPFVNTVGSSTTDWSRSFH